MRSIGRASADPQDKQPSASCPGLGQLGYNPLNGIGIQLQQNLTHLSKVLSCEIHRWSLFSDWIAPPDSDASPLSPPTTRPHKSVGWSRRPQVHHGPEDPDTT